MRKINKIIVHCSASDREEDDFLQMELLHTESKDVQTSWNGKIIKCFGFDDIAYHAYIDNDAAATFCRHESVIGAHCYGKNANSLGICIRGEHTFSKAQFKCARAVIDKWCEDFDLDPRTDVYPHHAFNETKTCPNFDISKLLPKEVHNNLDERVEELERKITDLQEFLEYRT